MQFELDIKSRPNHQRYLRILRAMPPRERLQQAMRLTNRSRELFRLGLKRRFPELDERQLRQLYLRLLARCHNQNY
jgi:hypothetical protein